MIRFTPTVGLEERVKLIRKIRKPTLVIED